MRPITLNQLLTVKTYFTNINPSRNNKPLAFSLKIIHIQGQNMECNYQIDKNITQVHIFSTIQFT